MPSALVPTSPTLSECYHNILSGLLNSTGMDLSTSFDISKAPRHLQSTMATPRQIRHSTAIKVGPILLDMSMLTGQATDPPAGPPPDTYSNSLVVPSAGGQSCNQQLLFLLLRQNIGPPLKLARKQRGFNASCKVLVSTLLTLHPFTVIIWAPFNSPQSQFFMLKQSTLKFSTITSASWSSPRRSLWCIVLVGR